MRAQITYYQKRAKEYERIYELPERQSELKELKLELASTLEGKHLLEVACGTGYWTHFIANFANSILATDVNQEVIDVARQKKYAKKNVFYKKLDYRELDQIDDQYDALFGGFIWSHIAKQRFENFLDLIQNKVVSGGQFVFLDNQYIHGESTPLSRQDEQGNTYQIRTLESGEQFEIIKNYPDKHVTNFLLSQFATDIEWIDLKYYWLLKFTKK